MSLTSFKGCIFKASLGYDQYNRGGVTHLRGGELCMLCYHLDFFYFMTSFCFFFTVSHCMYWRHLSLHWSSVKLFLRYLFRYFRGQHYLAMLMTTASKYLKMSLTSWLHLASSSQHSWRKRPLAVSPRRLYLSMLPVSHCSGRKLKGNPTVITGLQQATACLRYQARDW